MFVHFIIRHVVLLPVMEHAIKNTCIHTYVHTYIYIYIYIHTHTHTYIHRVSQEERTQLRESVP